MGKKEIPVLYMYIFQFIAEKVGKFDQEVNSRILLEVWHRHIYHIPRVYDYHFLKEMEGLDFIKKINSHKYIFRGSRIDEIIDKLAVVTPDDSQVPEKDYPLLYLYIYSRMSESFGKKNILVTGKQILAVWRKYIPNVSRMYDDRILSDMARYGLIRMINTQKFIYYGEKYTSKIKKLSLLNLW